MQKDYEKLYAELIIKKGVALKKGQEVFLVSSVTTYEFARKIVSTAYENGAKKVTVLYTDEKVTRQRFLNETEDEISHIENWENCPTRRNCRQQVRLYLHTFRKSRRVRGLQRK